MTFQGHASRRRIRSFIPPTFGANLASVMNVSSVALDDEKMIITAQACAQVGFALTMAILVTLYLFALYKCYQEKYTDQASTTSKVVKNPCSRQESIIVKA